MKKIVVLVFLCTIIPSLHASSVMQKYFLQHMLDAVRSGVVTRWILAARLQDGDVFVENKPEVMAVLTEVARSQAKVQLLVDLSNVSADVKVKDLQILKRSGVTLRSYPWAIEALDNKQGSPDIVDVFSLVNTCVTSDEINGNSYKGLEVSMQTLSSQDTVPLVFTTAIPLCDYDKFEQQQRYDLMNMKKMFQLFEKNWNKAKDL